MNRSTHLPRLAAALVIPACLGSCGTATHGPEPTRFLKSTGVDMSQRIERLPFEQSWRDPKVDITKYKHIVVRPVTTAFLNSDMWEESKSPSIPTKSAYLKRCTALARYWSKSLDKSFSLPICVFYKTSDTSKPGTLVLEVALTEVRFEQPAAGQTVTGLPMCAFEARVTDAATGALVSTAADRRSPEVKVLDPSTKTPNMSNEALCDEWSEQLMRSSNKEIFPTVKRSWFSLF